MIANKKEFDEALGKLGFLYESGKEQLQKLQYEQPIMTQRDVDQCYEYLYGIIREMRDLSAATMQKLHFKIEKLNSTMNTDKWIVDGKVELEALKAENAKLWGVLKLIQMIVPE